MEQYQSHVFETNPYELSRWRHYLKSKNKDECFLIMFAPVLEFAFQFLLEKRNQHQKLKQFLSEETVLKIFKRDMCHILLPIFVEAAVFELNHLSNEGRLEGETSQARFNYYLKVIQQQIFIDSFLEKYPVMSQIFDRTLSCYLHGVSKFYADFEGYFHLVRSILLTDFEPTEMTDYIPSSATCCLGSRVFIVNFINASSEIKRVMYKPRSLAVDISFQHYLSWINSKQTHVKFSTLTFVSGDDHGWSEYVNHEACQSLSEVKKYYYKIGMLCASLYLLNARDMHCGNLIVRGSDPVLIDLEALLTPVTSDSHFNFSCVIDSLLLPAQRKIGPYFKGMDNSGLGGNANQDRLEKRKYWENAGCDNMKILYKPSKTRAKKNQPYLSEKEEFECADYEKEFTSGFKALYKIWERNKEALLSKQSVLNLFEHVRTRILLRDNAAYDNILEDCYTPYRLTSEDLYNEKLDALSGMVENNEHYKSVLKSEKEDLFYGDLPYFYCEASQKAIYNSKGKKTDFPVLKSGLEEVRFKIANTIGEEDLQKQLAIIRNSFQARQFNHFGLHFIKVKRSKKINYQKKALQLALKIGDWIEGQRLIINDGMLWSSMQYELHVSWRQVLTTQDFSSGNLGVCRYLATLDFLNDQSQYKKTIETCLNFFDYQSEAEKSFRWQTQLGLFDGLAGILNTLLFLKELDYSVDIKKIVQHYKRHMGKAIKSDWQYDIFSGVSGMLLFLPNLKPYLGKSYHQLMQTMVDELLKHFPDPSEFPHLDLREQHASREMQNHLPALPSAGFGRGVAGIAVALASVQSELKDKRIQKWVKSAIEYIDQSYDPYLKTWPQIFETSKKKLLASHYCAGHVGVGLAMLSLSKYYPKNEKIENNLLRAIQYLKVNFYRKNNPTLCCGLLSDLDFMIEVHKHRPDLMTDAMLEKYFNDFVASMNLNAYKKLGVGFMHGLSGLGYVMLRVACPARVKSWLF